MLSNRYLIEENISKAIYITQNIEQFICDIDEKDKLLYLSPEQNSGLIIDIANNGKEAIKKFKSKEYMLILMDLQMPIMGGIEATKKIRKLDKNIPIIALTANAMKEDIIKTKKVGMNEHLNKPIDVKILYSTLLKYSSKQIKKDLSLNKNSNKFNFKHIDSKLGLLHMSNNEELYIKILNNFRDKYEKFDFESLNTKELEIGIHTIKGLSGNIGARFLSDIIKKLDKTYTSDLFNKFIKELKEVLKDLKPLQNYEKNEDKKCLESNIKITDKLFSDLKKAITTKRPNNYESVINKLVSYKLNNEDSELFDSVKKLLKFYKFNDAIRILNEK